MTKPAVFLCSIKNLVVNSISKTQILVWLHFLIYLFCKNIDRSYLQSLNYNYVKSVRIRSFFGPFFPAFGLNTDRCGVYLRVLSEYGEIPTKITPNTDTFHTVYYIVVFCSNETLLCNLSIVS